MKILKSSWSMEIFPGRENKPTGVEPYDLMMLRVAADRAASESKVGPGKEKELSVFELAPPTRTVSAGASGKKDAPPFVERIVLARVEDADGPVWPNQ